MANTKESSAVPFNEDPLLQFVAIDAAPTFLILLFLLYLSVRLRKRAWDSPSKRFSRELEICYVLLYSICVGFWKQGGADGTGLILIIVFFLSVNFLMTASATALVLKIVFPRLPERWKQLLQSKTATRWKVVFEIVAVVMILFYNMCWIIMTVLFIESSVHFSVLKIVIFTYYFLSLLIIAVTFILNILCIIFWLLYAFVALLKSPKKTELKLFLLLAVIVLDCSISLGSFLILSTTCFAYNTCSGFVSVFVSNTLCVSLFVVLVSVLTHSRDVFWCCDCCCSTRAPDGRPPHSTTPLLSGREVERQYTRSLEGSHSGSTTSYNPFEMSDCRPDYRPL